MTVQGAPQSRLGIDHLTVLGMPPTDFIDLAADAGLRSVGLFTHQRGVNPGGYPEWSLLADPQLRRETRARMAGRGIALAFGDGCHMAPEVDVAAWQPTLDLFAELGAERVNLLCWEKDRGRAFDQLARFAGMARAMDLQVVCEYTLNRALRRLDDFIEAINAAGDPRVGICVDCMHYFRGGHSVADMARFDPGLFRYVQFCDAPLKGEKHYLEEAMHQRLMPGEGELPLRELLAALPRGIPVSLELPHKRLADAGVGPRERVRRMVELTRAMLADLAERDAIRP